MKTLKISSLMVIIAFMFISLSGCTKSSEKEDMTSQAPVSTSDNEQTSDQFDMTSSTQSETIPSTEESVTE